MAATLSVSEHIAEKVYIRFREGKMGRTSFIHNFKCLAEREDKTGVFYLTWLLGQSDNVIIGRLLIDSIDALSS